MPPKLYYNFLALDRNDSLLPPITENLGAPILAETLGEAIAEHLKYIDGVDDILGKFYYLRDPEALEDALEQWILQTPAGRNWLDKQGFIHKEAVIKVIAQVETNLEQSNRDLVAKVQSLRSYVDSKGAAESTDS